MGVVSARCAPLFLVLVGQGIASMTSFLTVLALARWDGESGLGIFALGWSCWFIAMSLCDTLVATPYTYFLAQKYRIADDLPMAAAWSIGLLCTTLGSVFALLWLSNFSALASLSSLWPALTAAVMVASTREFVRRHLLATGRVSRLLVLDTASSFLQLAGISALAVLNLLSASNAFWTIAVAAFTHVLPLITLRHALRLVAARCQATRVLKAFFAYGHWLLIGGVCHSLTVQAYPWLAFSAGGERLVGLYAACNALLNMVAPLLIGLTNYFRPKFMVAQVMDPGKGFFYYVIRRIPVFGVPGFVLWLLLYFGGGILLFRIYGPRFLEGTAALSWFGLGMFAVSLAAPFQLALLALREPVTNLYYHGSALLCLSLSIFATAGKPSLIALGQIYGAVSMVSTIMLASLFFTHRTLRP